MSRALSIQEANVAQVNRQIEGVLALVRSRLGMECAFVSHFDQGRRHVKWIDGSSNVLTQGVSHPLEETYCNFIARGDMPGILRDTADDPIARSLDVTKAASIGCYLGVPVRLPSGDIYGTMCCLSSEARPTLNERDYEYLVQCAELISVLLADVAGSQMDYLVQEQLVSDRIAKRDINILFQPIYRLADDRLINFEALSRFPGMPYRSPDLWFADAERVGLEADLEFLAVEEAAAGLLSLPFGTSLSLNLSPATVLSKRFADTFANLPLERIILEVTEHSAIPCYTELRAAIDPLRQCGMRLAIDDVGAGYCSFRHVLDLQPDLIKLDMSLVRHIDADPGRDALATAITQFSKAVGCEIIAEGVETLGELDTLMRVGVTKVQGYLMSKPVPLHAAAALPIYGNIAALSRTNEAVARG